MDELSSIAPSEADDIDRLERRYRRRGRLAPVLAPAVVRLTIGLAGLPLLLLAVALSGPLDRTLDAIDWVRLVLVGGLVAAGVVVLGRRAGAARAARARLRGPAIALGTALEGSGCDVVLRGQLHCVVPGELFLLTDPAAPDAMAWVEGQHLEAWRAAGGLEPIDLRELWDETVIIRGDLSPGTSVPAPLERHLAALAERGGYRGTPILRQLRPTGGTSIAYASIEPPSDPA